jgi:hypothetical protein
VTIVGDAGVPFSFSSDWMESADYLPPIVISGVWNVQTSLAYPTQPEVLSGQKVCVRFSVTPSGSTIGGEAIVVESSKIENGMSWGVTNDTSRHLSCNDDGAVTICDISSLPFTSGSPSVLFLCFTPSTESVGPLEANFRFESQSFVPLTVIPNITVFGYLGPESTPSNLWPLQTSRLPIPATIVPATTVPAGTQIRLHYLLRSSGTSVGSETVSIEKRRLMATFGLEQTGMSQTLSNALRSEHGFRALFRNWEPILRTLIFTFSSGLHPLQ